MPEDYSDTVLNVVAFDPGVTTGFATGMIEDGHMKVSCGQHKWNHHMLWLQLEGYRPKYIVCETFQYRNRARKGLELISREYIGVINLFCQMNNSVELNMQEPGTVMHHFTDKRLRADGLYKPGKPHAMDAMRHLLHWFTFGRGYEFNTQGYSWL